MMIMFGQIGMMDRIGRNRERERKIFPILEQNYIINNNSSDVKNLNQKSNDKDVDDDDDDDNGGTTNRNRISSAFGFTDILMIFFSISNIPY